MVFEVAPKLPVLDFSKETLKPGTSCWLKACADVRQALEEYGCFAVEYKKLSLELRNGVFGVLKELFDLPTEVKMQNKCQRPLLAILDMMLGFLSMRAWALKMQQLLRQLRNSPISCGLLEMIGSDTSFTTILHQNQVNGLEVDTKDGKINVDFSPSSFVVMAGDALMAPEELVDEEYPLKYKPLDHLGYLHFFQKTRRPIKDYCGI
ncbi:hypothetical protein GH714_023927 [Hevea brasiliensis]|uniref:Uncharacterized protein n=1 Tax=Hevea brasiliensis TaxID=3981 RepID=A0A6A6LMW8_HEVBR|nr:hypothetical protein GH714_023927 [Hevea brasiliensis]